MRAILLAAGYGTRLRPLTEKIPKCLVPIHGKPLIDYWFENLLLNGIEEIVINTHYLATIVEQYVAKSIWKSRVKVAYEQNLLGTGGTLVHNRDYFQGASFLVAHADNLTIFNVPNFIRAHEERPSGTELTMMLFESDNPQSCGVVELNDLGVVINFHEKIASPPGNLANAAVYIIEPSVLDNMSKKKHLQDDISTQLIPEYMGKIATYKNTIYHRDIGTMESWRIANLDFPIPGSLAIK